MSDAGGSTVATTNTEGKAYSPYAILLHGGLDFVTLQESELTPNRQSRWSLCRHVQHRLRCYQMTCRDNAGLQYLKPYRPCHGYKPAADATNYQMLLHEFSRISDVWLTTRWGDWKCENGKRGTSKMQGSKTRDLNMWHQCIGVENAGPNAMKRRKCNNEQNCRVNNEHMLA